MNRKFAKHNKIEIIRIIKKRRNKENELIFES
jgi:hypothetical protein